jgi:transposase
MKNYTLKSRPLSQAYKASNTKSAIRAGTRPVPAPACPTPCPGGSSIPAACALPVLTKKFQAALSKASEAGDQTPLVHVSIDRDKSGGHVFAALGLGHAHDLGKRTLEEFHHLIGHLVKQGLKLIVVQESCGFGYELHRTLAAMPGVEAHIVHCQPLSGKRKTDRMDARQLCLRLQQFSSGNHDALRPIRVPTAEQVRARSEVTLRGQALGSIGRLQRQGWSLMQQHDVHDLPPRWWTRVAWPKVRKRLSQQPGHNWLLTMLEPIRAIIVQLRTWQRSIEDLLLPDAKRCLASDEASDEMDDAHSEQPAAKNPAANAQREPITAASAQTTAIATPHGMGALTRAVLDRRIGDWHRFNNRKQVGSFIGACPGEYSSGGVQQQGGKIDRRGDPHLRALMTELVWRLRKFQPQWRGFVKFAAILGPESKAGRPARKKAITACVRLLFIDLWRLFTGQLQASAIGLN